MLDYGINKILYQFGYILDPLIIDIEKYDDIETNTKDLDLNNSKKSISVNQELFSDNYTTNNEVSNFMVDSKKLNNKCI